jgi:hypothetical protein
VVWGKRVFVTCEDPNSTGGIVLTLDSGTGAVLWQKQYKLTPYRFHNDNSYAAATPVVDADFVYVLWQTAEETILAALDHSGKEIWRRNLPGIHSQFGPGTSPIIFGDEVVLTHEQEGDETHASTWIALDRQTGQTRWSRQRRNSETSCSTPCVYRPKGDKPQLIFTSESHGVTGIDSAGRESYHLAKVHKPPHSLASSPSALRGLLSLSRPLLSRARSAITGRESNQIPRSGSLCCELRQAHRRYWPDHL